MNIIAQQMVGNQHFQLHFEPEYYVLYEESLNNWRRANWETLRNCGGVQRIHYNTNKWKNYIIIDIDNDDIYKYRRSHLPEPNFILKNKDKAGAHLFYVLDRGIFHKNTYFLNLWRKVFKGFTELAGGDTLAKGYVGKFIHSTSFEYIQIEPSPYRIMDLFESLELAGYHAQTESFDTLEEIINDLLLYDIEPSQEPSNNVNYDVNYTKKKSTTTPKQKNLDGFAEGERNDGIFKQSSKYAYTIVTLDEEVFKNKVAEYIHNLNDSLLSPLPEPEIRAMIKSIVKWCLKNKEIVINYDPEKRAKEDNKNRGVMGLQFQPIEKSKKQAMGAEYSNGQRKDKTLSKILETIEYLKANNLKISVSSIAKHSKISRPAIYRHKENLPI